MTAERWGQVKAVLAEILEADETERSATLDRLCASDPELRESVAALLKFDDDATGLLDSAVFPGAALRDDVAPPSTIGPYRVLRELGHGGMGVVYLGERADGEYDKQVAIKLVTAGRLSPDLERRFRRERQILAQLDHPGIAKLLDGGATADGRPYFVMEYIEGLPLLEYCDREQLSIAARLGLFLEICGAVAHAHQRLIVHRDLKPANVLVTSTRVAKLLDFGLGRTLDSGDPSGEATLAGVPMMTPAYASPEQVSGELFTVSSDIYALGLILYELLSSRRPYHVPSDSLAEMVRVVCEQEPLPLSQVIVSDDIARNRGLTPERLQRRLAGDLEKITAKALAKLPRMRYASVDDFAADVRRHLDGQPVRARPATWGYRLGKLLSRHRVAIPGAAIAVLLILAFAGTAWWQARRAERRFQDVRELANSLLFEVHDAIADVPGSTAARELLVKRAMDYLERLARESAGDPGLAREVAIGYERVANVQGNISEANLGKMPAALENYRRSAEILERLQARSPSDASLRRDYLRVLPLLADATGEAGHVDEGLVLARKAVALSEADLRLRPKDPGAIEDLAVADSSVANLLNMQNRFSEALPVTQRVLESFEQLSKLRPGNANVQRSLAISHKKLAALYGVAKRYGESRSEYEQALAIDLKSLQGRSGTGGKLDLSFDYSDLGWVMNRQQQYADALAAHRHALELRLEVARADPNNFRAARAVASSTGRVSFVLRNMGDLKGALEESEQAVALWKKLVDRPSPEWSSVTELADAYQESAEIYRALAEQAAGSAAARTYWLQAAAAYDQSRAAFARVDANSALPAALKKQFAEVTEQAVRCRKEAR